jgi:hypothetical protein
VAYRTRALIIFALAAALLELDNSTSAAMTVTPATNGEIIRAEGPVEPGDAERLRSLVTLRYLQQHGLVRFGATLHLNSPGGSVVGAIELANAIRERGLKTHVATDAGCYSACTIASLGGTKRTVLGKFGIHAMSMERGAGARGNELDGVQRLSGTLITVAQSLVGDSRLITGMLAILASEIRLVHSRAVVAFAAHRTSGRSAAPIARRTASSSRRARSDGRPVAARRARRTRRRSTAHSSARRSMPARSPRRAPPPGSRPTTPARSRPR